MKKITFWKSLFLLCALIVGSSSAWADTYKKVTSSSEIAAGKKYVLVCENKNLAMKVYSSGTKCDCVDITISNNTVSSVEDINVLTIEAGENGWYFKQENGNYLYSSAAKNLKAENTTDKTLCTITNDFQITMGSRGRLQYNASSPRFCPYTSNQTAAYLYVLEDSSPLASISLSGTYPTTFHVDDAFSHEGMTVTATYENSTTKDVTANATFSTPDMSTDGNKTVTVSYTENNVEKTTSYDITVNAPATLESISLSGTYPTVFTQGDAFSSEGIVVTANWDDATTSNVTENAAFSGYNMTIAGNQTVIVSYGGKIASYNITVNKYIQPTSITVDNWNTLFGTSFTGALSGDDLKAYSGTADNVTIEYAKGSGKNMYISTSELRAYGGNSFTVTAPNDYFIYEIKFTKNSNWGMSSATPGDLDSQTWTAASNTVSVSFDFSGRTDIVSMTITLVPKLVVAYADGWMSYVTPCDVTFPDNVEAYIVTAIEPGIAREKITEAPEGTPVILHATDGIDSYALPVPNYTPEPLTTNKLKVSDGSITIDDDNYKKIYVLTVVSDKAGFGPLKKGKTLAAGKAYIEYATAQARDFFTFDGETTGIANVDVNDNVDANAPMYNLAGQRVNKSYKGVVIVNGKKMLNK